MKAARSRVRKPGLRAAVAALWLGSLLLIPGGSLGAGAPTVSPGPAASEQAPLSMRNLQLMQSLEKRKEALDRREAALKREEDRLQGLKQEIEERLADVSATEKRVLQIMGMADKLGEEKLDRLAKLYSSMRPEEAGPLLDRINEGVALKLLMRMKARQASRILPYMQPEKAARLTDRMAKAPKPVRSSAK